MGCRCGERTEALRNAGNALRRGEVRTAIRQGGFVGRTLIEDTRSGALRQAAKDRLAQLRGGRR